MRKVVASVVIVFALALGTVDAQSTQSFGVSLSTSVFPIPFPMLGVHMNFDDLIAEDVGVRVSLHGIALGVSGAWLFGGISQADVVWALSTDDGAAVRPYVGGGAGFAFVGAGFEGALGAEFAPQVGALAGASFPLDDLRIFVEGRGNVSFGFFDETLWWLSIAVGLDFAP